MVRLKGGDPLIFARAGEEIEACQAANIAVEVVPGITAAQGAAARLGLPLTDREQARRLQYVTGHAKDGALPDDIDWQSLADPATTTAIYMPAQDACRAGREGAWPRASIRKRRRSAIARATRPDQAVVAAPIGELPARLAQAGLPGPLLVMLGACHRRARSRRPVRPARTQTSADIVADRHNDRDLRAVHFRRRRRQRLPRVRPAPASSRSSSDEPELRTMRA